VIRGTWAEVSLEELRPLAMPRAEGFLSLEPLDGEELRSGLEEAAA